MTSLSHDGGESLLFKVVEVDTTCLFGFSILVELDAWSFGGNIGRQNGLRSVDKKEGRKARSGADLSLETPDYMWQFS
jgi:hypothetical protein